MENGEERPMALASRSLNSAEKKYARFHKEALAIIWGVKEYQLSLWKKFHIGHRSSTSIDYFRSKERDTCYDGSTTATLRSISART